MGNTSNPVVVETEVDIHDDQNQENPHKPISGDSTVAPNSSPDNRLRNRLLKCIKCICHRLRNCLLVRCTKCIGGSRNRLRPRGLDPEHASLGKEEAHAYMMLLQDLDEATKEHTWPVIKLSLRVFALMTFISIFVTALFAPKIKHVALLKLKASSWVALLMVAVAGLPCIRLVTLLVSEPVLWILWFRKIRKYDSFFVRQLKRSVDVTLWFGLVLWVWFKWFSGEITHDTEGARKLGMSKDEYKHFLDVASSQITRLLLALTLGSTLWVLKSVVYLKLEADLLYKRLCPRIRNSILDLYGIQFITHELEGKWSFLEMKRKGKGENRINRVKTYGDWETNAPEMSFWMAITYLKRETAPIWILKKLTYTFSKLMKNEKPAVLIRLEEANNEKYVKEADEKYVKEADAMYQQFVGKEDTDVITQEHLRRYGLQDKELIHNFRSFLSDEDVKEEDLIITRDQFLRWAVRAFEGTLALESTIASSERVFMKLSALMSACVVVVAIVVWLLLSDLITASQLVILFAPFLSASFIFGESLKRAFGSIVFVFGMRPFDAGDRVIIDGNKMRVNELGILTTSFFVKETGDEFSYPNYDLGSKGIVSLNIEDSMSDFVEFNIPIGTSEELFLDLQIRIKKSLDDEPALTSNTLVVKHQIVEQNVVVKVYFEYFVAHSAKTRASHRSKVINTIERLLGELTKAKESESKEEEYKSEIVKFKIGTKLKLSKIEDINDEILRILRKHHSFKDKSRVIFVCIDKDSATIDVQMRYREDDLLKNHDDKEKIKREVVDAIQANQGKVIDGDVN